MTEQPNSFRDLADDLVLPLDAISDYGVMILKLVEGKEITNPMDLRQCLKRIAFDLIDKADGVKKQLGPFQSS